MFHEDDNLEIAYTACSVGELTRIITTLFQSIPLLQDVWVFGEVSNLAKPTSGHIYFTLKDQNASIKCVIWKSYVNKELSLLENGVLIEAHGKIDIYPVGGIYQLYIDKVRMQGTGYLFLEFIKLKQKLEKEGIFDSERKRQLPSFPKKIGLITSTSGAAIRDILSTLRKRYPLVEVYLYPTAVQGIDAVNEIVFAMDYLNHYLKPDVILLARGGGDLEDLYPFNTEEVARAISNSASPVITGIGHETDFTLADFAADVRAPTPTGAAVMVAPDISSMRNSLLEIQQRIIQKIATRIFREKEYLNYLRNLLLRTTPKNIIVQQWQTLDSIRDKIYNKIEYKLSMHRININQLKQKLDLINPHRIMEHGFSLVMKNDGRIIRNSNEVQKNERVIIQLYQGRLGVDVKEII